MKCQQTGEEHLDMLSAPAGCRVVGKLKSAAMPDFAQISWRDLFAYTTRLR